jgi:hypothetical protein
MTIERIGCGTFKYQACQSQKDFSAFGLLFFKSFITPFAVITHRKFFYARISYIFFSSKMWRLKGFLLIISSA